MIFIKRRLGEKALPFLRKNMPIIDYHCHLDPKEIYENNNFSNLTEAWLGGDHYKWRLMRACGVPEEKSQEMLLILKNFSLVSNRTKNYRKSALQLVTS